MEKVLLYTKAICFWVKHLEVVAQCSLNWIQFRGILHCCVRYSTIEYQNLALKILLKVMAKFGFRSRFHDLKFT